MSSTCSLPNSPSPTSCKQEASPGEADLFNKYSPRSTAKFSLKPSSKWKTVLAHLAPPRLLPAAPSRRRRVSSTALSSSSALASDLPFGFPPIDQTSICAESCVDSRVPLCATESTETPVITIDDNNLLTSCDTFPFSLDVANDVEKLLHIFLETPLPDDINKRTLTLGALCALCVSSPNNTNRCVRAGGVNIMIDALNSTAQPSHPSPTAAAIVEESEKALLLLQLLTSSSEDGCIAALQHSSSIIATLSKKLLRVSESCTASAIAVLTALCRRSDAGLFRKAVSETAIPSKLVVVLQVASKESTKRRAGRLLRLLAEPQHPVTHNYK